MRKFILLAACVFALAVITTAQNRSVYTSTKTSACRTIESKPDEGGDYIGECAGVGGYKVQVLEGDLRQSINVITAARKKFELNFWNLYPSFSAVGEKIEWRVKGGIPHALIVRYYVADPEGGKKSKSYLIVVKVGRKESCVTEVVDPMAKQNEKARELADAASAKPCKATGE